MPDRDTLWLWLSSADGMGPARINDLWVTLQERHLTLEDFFDLDEAIWAQDLGVNARAVKGLAEQKARMSEMIELAESLRQREVHLLSLESDRYSASLRKSLGRTTPPLLYALGNLSLLERKGAAVVGARDASGRGLLLARYLGESLVRAGLVLVSGGARGTDKTAHVGALAAGGATVVVLSCGILRYRPGGELSERADLETALYLSELPPHMTWQTGGAMARNRIVCGLASAVVVVEAKESGGTVQAAKTARDLGKPLFVVQFDEYDAHSAGNASLLRHGAKPLKAEGDPSGETWRVDVGPILTEVETGEHEEPATGQLDLF